MSVTELQDLDDKIKSMMEVSENKAGDRSRDGKARICKMCGKEGAMNLIKMHIEANHITGVSHSCSLCGKTSRSKHGLNQHMNRNHKEVLTGLLG